MRRRAVLDIDWEGDIKEVLTGVKGWGCLNKEGQMFRVSGFQKWNVPLSIIKSMVQRGLLSVTQTGFYKYESQGE